MDSQPTDALSPDDPASGGSAHAARALEKLVEIELDVADALRRIALAAAKQAEDGSAADLLAGAGDLGLSMERIARAIRRTVILQQRLADDDIAKARQRRAEKAEHKARIQARKDQIGGLMVCAIEVPGRREPDVERLYSELDRWVEEHQYDEDFTDIRIDVLLTQVAKHIGIPIELDQLFEGDQIRWTVVSPEDPDDDEAPALRVGAVNSS